jgi:hypothetical protein
MRLVASKTTRTAARDMMAFVTVALRPEASGKFNGLEEDKFGTVNKGAKFK